MSLTNENEEGKEEEVEEEKVKQDITTTTTTTTATTTATTSTTSTTPPNKKEDNDNDNEHDNDDDDDNKKEEDHDNDDDDDVEKKEDEEEEKPNLNGQEMSSSTTSQNTPTSPTPTTSSTTTTTTTTDALTSDNETMTMMTNMTGNNNNNNNNNNDKVTLLIKIIITIVIPCVIATFFPQILVYYNNNEYNKTLEKTKTGATTTASSTGEVHDGSSSTNVLKHSIDEFLSNTILPSIESSWERINNTVTNFYISPKEKRPGYRLCNNNKGAKSKYGIFMIPGFVSSGLEVWSGEECAQKHFRQRLWGSVGMAETVFNDRECWIRHLSLNPETGMDPKNIRVRASLGFDAADYFIANYWVWGKLIENLADVGYDSNSMYMMSYDWRLAWPLLETRDGYLTKLKYSIEAHVKHSHGQKVVLISHSMGSALTLYFLKWVTEDESNGGGGGGKEWVENHIHAYINIGGALLGAVKSLSALLSGEMRDTAEIYGPLGDIVERYLGRKQRRNMFQTWGALWSLVPKGGDAIWNVGADLCDSEEAVHNHECAQFHNGDADNAASADAAGNSEIEKNAMPIITFTDYNHHHHHHNEKRKQNIDENNKKGAAKEEEEEGGGGGRETTSSLSSSSLASKFSSKPYRSLDESIQFLFETGKEERNGVQKSFSISKLYNFFGAAAKHDSTKNSNMTWHDPTATPLPYAPSLKIYCLYGVGINTERAYYYNRNSNNVDNDDSTNDNNINNSIPNRDAADAAAATADPPFIMNITVQESNKNVHHGVRFADGDDSVPLMSLGYMCVDGWIQNPEHNPSNIKVITREFQHKPTFDINDPTRTGPHSATHVDMMGNVDMLEDVIKIVTDHNVESVNSDRIISDIKGIAKRINAHKLGGIRGRTGAHN